MTVLNLSPLRCERPAAGAGMRPRQGAFFLCFAKERRQSSEGVRTNFAKQSYGCTKATRLSRPAGCSGAEAAPAGKKELALLACGQRSSDNFFSDPPPQPRPRRDKRDHTCGSLRIASGDRMLAQRATNPPGPLLSRRAAQDRTDQKGRLSESAQRASSSLFPSCPSSAEQSALGRPAQWGRLFFGGFLLAKQKKVTAQPGAQPGNRPQAASPRRGESPTAPRNHQP